MSERTLAEYIDAVAQSNPAPGAGSVSAMVGSLGCALGEMVCGITIAGAKTQQDDGLHNALITFQECRERLLALSKDDESAYVRFWEARAMPKSTKSEQLVRSETLKTTLLRAAEVPLSIAETSCAALELLVEVARSGSKYTLADIATAAYVLEAAVKGALENVWVNLRMMKGEQTKSLLAARAEKTKSRVTNALAATLDAIAQRPHQT